MTCLLFVPGRGAWLSQVCVTPRHDCHEESRALWPLTSRVSPPARRRQYRDGSSCLQTLVKILNMYEDEDSHLRLHYILSYIAVKTVRCIYILCMIHFYICHEIQLEISIQPCPYTAEWSDCDQSSGSDGREAAGCGLHSFAWHNMTYQPGIQFYALVLQITSSKSHNVKDSRPEQRAAILTYIETL